MLVGARHDEAVEAASLQLGAQRRQTLGWGRRYVESSVVAGQLGAPGGQRPRELGAGLWIDQLDPLRTSQSLGCGSHTAHQGFQVGRLGRSASLPQKLKNVVRR
jgi:hypothetical protein